MKNANINVFLYNSASLHVEGVNIVKKHQKPNQMNQVGGIVEMEAPIHVSNVKKIEKTEPKKKAKKD